MTDVSGLVRTSDVTLPIRIAGAALAASPRLEQIAEFDKWFADSAARNLTTVTPVPLEELAGWSFDERTGNLAHESGKFFTVEGLDVRQPGGRVPHWTQPIINQPEIGILGILVKDFGGVLHCLMQAKVEPGNCNGVQISPTVQATRSNYTRVHRGKPVPYLAYFTDTARHRVIADVLQSEQGSWFYQKRNRNMIVEVREDVEVLEDFAWVPLNLVHWLLSHENVVNMDARTVLSCLPFSGMDLVGLLPSGDDDFRASLVRSCSELSGSRHGTDTILSWITEARARADTSASRIPLRDVRRWVRSPTGIAHETGLYFGIMGVDVHASGREVARWSQPMLRPSGDSLAAFLVRRIDGVLHVLANARVEPGYFDAVELAPTVQCTVGNYADVPPADRLPFLDEVLTADPSRIRFDATHSEEGGRFYHARTRYVVVETDAELAPREYPDHRWLTLNQLVGLLRHSHYVNVQARSLVACLHSMFGREWQRPNVIVR
ncbi:NDP-hexose 2,3-dehydratase family protein [Actinophytocola oryzae]|uniref:Oxidase EvaA n=1 Tax=Actinophytocola oryzae TaxID=502181 RepID=A0A4R7UTV9_9PSEU|nr:NDP-hexose 2,3-dehydratase family protein [Actinophytocola oryzae]TDV38582.1 oxidase EvaA [Actinophytocola oryzae]